MNTVNQPHVELLEVHNCRLIKNCSSASGEKFLQHLPTGFQNLLRQGTILFPIFIITLFLFHCWTVSHQVEQKWDRPDLLIFKAKGPEASLRQRLLRDSAPQFGCSCSDVSWGFFALGIQGGLPTEYILCVEKVMKQIFVIGISDNDEWCVLQMSLTLPV